VAGLFVRVIGVDFSASNLETAERSLEDLGLKNVDLYNSDLSDMGVIPEASVDFAYSMAVFMHMPNETKKKALKELARVLAPRGVAILIEIVPIVEGAFDCPDIEEEKWEDMIEEAGLKIESVGPAGPFMKFKLTKGGK
jgi:ubiquinone/menaquinone biosynthesis C-methylase UbiE